MHIAQLINIYVVVGLPCRHSQSLLQFHSKHSNRMQNNEKKIKKNKKVNIKRKNKICPFLSIIIQVSKSEVEMNNDSIERNSLIEKALDLAEKHDLPESFKKVLVDCLKDYVERNKNKQ